MQNSDTTPAEPNPPSRRGRDPPAIYKVPRRFDLATVFVVTFAYAAFFGSMRALGVPTGVQAAIIGLLSVVGIVQLVVPARYVRVAAIACGWSAFVGLFVFLNFQERVGPRGPSSSMICTALIFGPLLGYCAGVVVAGVFLVSDYARKGFARVLGKRID